MGRAQRRGHRGGVVRGGHRTGGFRRVAAAVGVAALTVLLTGCTPNDLVAFGWPEGVTPQAENMRTLWTWSVVAALVVGAITWGAMFWAMIFHRKRAGDDDTPPRQTQYNLPVEIVFTVIPTIIVAVLFAFTVQVQNNVNDLDDPAQLRVDIIGFQWNWEFIYPETRTTTGAPVTTIGTPDTIPLLVLPTDRTIYFSQRSNDVIHSFFVPEFLFKRDVFPMPEQNDQQNEWRIERIEREGAFVGRCAELCGAYHAFMNFEVRALRPDLFDRYLQLRTQANPATGAPYTAAEALQTLDCGQWCSPTAVTTYPFETNRTVRSASQPPVGS